MLLPWNRALNRRLWATWRSVRLFSIGLFTFTIIPFVKILKGIFFLARMPPCNTPVLDAFDNRVRMEIILFCLKFKSLNVMKKYHVNHCWNLHLCVLTYRESNGDVHLNNNYCFRCRLPNAADAKNSDRCIRQFDDLSLKFHRLRVEGTEKRKKFFDWK